MTKLDVASRFPDPDAAYQVLVDAHRELSEAQSDALNAQLVLLLANHIGDLEVLRDAIAVAKRGAARA